MVCSDLRHRITFLKPVTSEETDELNAHNIQYTDFKTVWASVAPMTGKEYAESQKLRSETTYNIIVRYRHGITADMKIRYKNKEFNIVSVLNVGERNEILKIIAVEQDTSGKNNDIEDYPKRDIKIGGGYFGV